MKNLQILPQYNLILIRYGEIWLKSQKVKMRMLKILINNIKRMLTKKSIHFYKYQITNDSSRILFFFDNNDLPEALEVLEKSFGVYSFSPALRTSNNLKNITDRALEVSQSILKSEDTFAIRVKRSGKHNYSSLDVAKLVGKAVLENFSTLNLKVNLTKPNKIIFIEIRDDFSYIFTEIIKSKWGGLPIETRKKIIVMDVGRIEDLLSGFLLMRRGCLIYPILFKLTNNREFNDITKSNWKQLTKYIPFIRFSLEIIDMVNILNLVKRKIQNNELICGICRLIRLNMLSKLVKRKEIYEYIRAITDGVNLNQSNLCFDYVDLNSIALNHHFSNIPIFTPLIGFDLKEIKDRLKKISNKLKNFDYCDFKPKNQDFDSKKIIKLYQSLDLEDLIEKNLKRAEEIRII